MTHEIVLSLVRSLPYRDSSVARLPFVVPALLVLPTQAWAQGQGSWGGGGALLGGLIMLVAAILGVVSFARALSKDDGLRRDTGSFMKTASRLVLGFFIAGSLITVSCSLLQ